MGDPLDPDAPLPIALSLGSGKPRIRPAFVYFVPDNPPEKRFVVLQSHCIDYIPYQAGWMCDEDLQGDVYVPDVDLQEGDSLFFASEDDALTRVAELYRDQLAKTART